MSYAGPPSLARDPLKLLAEADPSPGPGSQRVTQRTHSRRAAQGSFSFGVWPGGGAGFRCPGWAVGVDHVELPSGETGLWGHSEEDEKAHLTEALGKWLWAQPLTISLYPAPPPTWSDLGARSGPQGLSGIPCTRGQGVSTLHMGTPSAPAWGHPLFTVTGDRR